MKIPTVVSPSEKHRMDVLGKHTTAKELKHARGPNSKLYDRGSGQFTVVSAPNILHYISDSGEPEEIELTFTEGSNSFTCTTAPYKLTVPKDIIGYEYVSRISGIVRVELQSILGQPVVVPKPKVKDNLITWKDVTPGLTFILALKEDGVEIYKTIADKNSAKEWVWLVHEEQGSATFARKTFGVDADNFVVKSKGEVSDEADGHFLYTETVLDEVGRIKDRATRKREWFNDPKYPLLIDVGTSDAISNTADDGKEFYSYWYSVPYSTYSANIWGYPIPGAPNWHGGLRFRTLNIPQGATINSATITVEVVAIEGTSPTMHVYADDVDNAALFAGTDRPSTVTKTTAFTVWQETATGSRNVTVTDIVQEIVNRAGWVTNNNIRFALLNTVGGINQRVLVNDLKAGAGTAATLTCDYTAAGGVQLNARRMRMGVGM